MLPRMRPGCRRGLAIGLPAPGRAGDRPAPRGAAPALPHSPAPGARGHVTATRVVARASAPRCSAAARSTATSSCTDAETVEAVAQPQCALEPTRPRRRRRARRLRRPRDDDAGPRAPRAGRSGSPSCTCPHRAAGADRHRGARRGARPAVRHPRARRGGPPDPRGRRPGRWRPRGPLPAAGRLPRRRGDGDEQRRPGARPGRRRRRAGGRPGPRLLRPHRPADHRARAGRRPPPATAPRPGRAHGADRARATSTTGCSRRSSATARSTADDVHLLERAATVAALAITKEQAVSAVESKYRAEFLRDALAGRAGTPGGGRGPRGGPRLGHRPPARRRRGRDRRGRRPLQPLARGGRRRSRNASPAPGTRPWRCATPAPRSWGSARRSSRCCGVPDGRRHRGDHAHRDRDRAGHQRDRRRRPAHLLDRRLAPGRVRGRPARRPTRRRSRPSASGGSCTATRRSPTSTASGVFRLLALIPDSADLRRFVDEALGALADRRLRRERRPAPHPRRSSSTPT